MSLVIYLLGDILGKLPGTSVIAGLAWSIIIAIVIKCTGILSDDIADNCVYSMNFALKALLPMLVAGIGINSLKITDKSTQDAKEDNGKDTRAEKLGQVGDL